MKKSYIFNAVKYANIQSFADLHTFASKVKSKNKLIKAVEVAKEEHVYKSFPKTWYADEQYSTQYIQGIGIAFNSKRENKDYYLFAYVESINKQIDVFNAELDRNEIVYVRLYNNNDEDKPALVEATSIKYADLWQIAVNIDTIA